jgi:TPR repeat protein
MMVSKRSGITAMTCRFRRLLFFGLAFSVCAVGASAQVPPPETNALTLTNVGPVAVPHTCPCITHPFSVPAIRPGWGYPSGPAAPEADAAPSPADRKRQSARDAEDRARLNAVVEDGLAGNPNASITIGMLLTAGTAIPRNDEEAARWYYLAALQGHRDAYVQLGHRYHRGLGVQQNDTTAAYWYQAGALSGDRIAMVALGSMYAAGRGVPQDWPTAVGWWQRARSDGGHPLASRFIGDAYACGLGIEQNHEEALRAYQEWADRGDVSSSVRIGQMYVSGCVSPNDEAAFAAFRRAADQGDPEAQVALSSLYREGRGVEANPYQAYFWARMAELRLQSGALRARATTQAQLAAALLPVAAVQDADTFVKAMVADGSKPVR